MRTASLHPLYALTEKTGQAEWRRLTVKMPRHVADLEEALQKKGGLTLSQLANYDDLITDALVDRVRLFPAYTNGKGVPRH